jgi:hypothetical protein
MSKERILVMVRADILPEVKAAWNLWYDTQYIPHRLKVLGFLSTHHYMPVEGEPKC